MLTPCLGRDTELARVRDLLDQQRWVTVVGPPGVGKTLLARHATSDAGPVTWIDVARLERREDIIGASLDALGAKLAPGDDEFSAMTRAVDESDTLIVLDGIGPKLATLGKDIREVMEATASSRLLCLAHATAGQPVEHVLRLGPLALPAPSGPLAGAAVDLFLTRLTAAGGSGLDLSRQDAQIRRLLTATGGLPLLIEQVAVQVALIGMADVVPTASLSEAVHRSYLLLDPVQQQCFRRLSQVDAPVPLAVLAAVTGISTAEAAQVAAALVQRSLLEMQPDGRLAMLAPIRRHGAFLTAATDDADHVRAGLLAWADAMVPADALAGPGEAAWLADLPLVRQAVATAAATRETRASAYGLANRTFSTLYSSMRVRDAFAILQEALGSGDGPPEIGAQIARRAGIAASEIGGTYAGLPLLDRAETHAMTAAEPNVELARNASIRAEMHLDAAALADAETEALRVIDLGDLDPYATYQARRTLVDVYTSTGDFAGATAQAAIVGQITDPDMQWMALSARLLLGRIALEQGRMTEAAAIARAVDEGSRRIGEDRIALMAETQLRQTEPGADASTVDPETLPWAIRLGVVTEDARALLLAGEVTRCAGLAADVVVLADTAVLGRDAINARLILGEALFRLGELDQALSTWLAALDKAAAAPLPLRAADALDGIAMVAKARGLDLAKPIAATARELRRSRQAKPWGLAASGRISPGSASAPAGWLLEGRLGAHVVPELLSAFDAGPRAGSGLDQLTRAERAVAQGVADGLTSRAIAEQLFVSPRTVDAHLAHIYRKLEITGRAKLAALVTAAR